MKKQIDLKLLSKNWPSPYVARNKVGEFTGGMITPGSLANFDSQGKGPKGRFIVNRKTVYPVQDLIEWLEKRVNT